MNCKFYINGQEVTARQFKIANYLYNKNNHYVMIKNHLTYEWGRIPKLITYQKKKDNQDEKNN